MAPFQRKNATKRNASLPTPPRPTVHKKHKQSLDGTKSSWLTRSSKKKKKQQQQQDQIQNDVVDRSQVQWQGKHEQAEWLTQHFRSTLGSVLSSLELDSIPDGSIVQLSKVRDRTNEDMSFHMKNIFYQSWEETLSKGDLSSGKMEAGSPAVLLICSSASRCVDLLRGMRVFCSKCKPVKLFAKHIKIDEQIEALKDRVNIGAGTPNRIKKLMDMGVLGSSRLEVVLLDMKKDAKGLTLFTVPEVREEFWDLYKTHFHTRVLDQKLQICLY